MWQLFHWLSYPLHVCLITAPLDKTLHVNQNHQPQVCTKLIKVALLTQTFVTYDEKVTPLTLVSFN